MYPLNRADRIVVIGSVKIGRGAVKVSKSLLALGLKSSTVLTGLEAADTEEHAVEVREVAESGVEGNLGDRGLALEEKVAGFGNPQMVEVFDEGFAGAAFQIAIESGGCHAVVVRHLV